jgi:hypothetical protein
MASVQWRREDMLKMIAVCTILIAAAALPAQAQSPSAHPTGAALPHAAAAPGLAGDQFSSEQAAKAHCPGDAIVWANTGGSKAYHVSGDRYYGKTRHGAFMCQKEADQAGFHAAGHRPAKAAAKNTSAKPAH